MIWEPIVTAPKDGTHVDLWCTPPRNQLRGGGYARVPDCWYSDGKWWRYDEMYGDEDCRRQVHNVTHWMNRPMPPRSV